MRLRSIISQVVALHVIAISVTSILIPLALYWLLSQAASNLHREMLRGQAITVSSFLRAQPDGSVVVDIPDDERPLYADDHGLYAYAVIDASGQVLFSSRTDGAALFQHGESAPRDWIVRRRATGSDLFGVTVARTVGKRPYWIQVAQDLAHDDVIIDDIVAAFISRVAWIVFPILLVLLMIDILIFRRVLEPVRGASTTAAAIGPARTDIRLPEQAMPTEIVPLVRAVNQALERLEAGFRAQLEFTADVAHELRTPLAIMRARVDSLDAGPPQDALRADIVGMARTVGQVLDMAELESFVVSNDARADLHAVCSDAVGFMAPLAVDMSMTIALTGAEGPVWVHGHPDALFRAVRNLVENAARHTPRGTSIEVDVSSDGTVRVLDDGPGVPEADRQSIFRRFWRRDRGRADSRGLGLAIVARVAEAHGGSIHVENRSEGGAVFTLKLRPV